jgi:rhodanese-related sulfurtransferase
VSDRQAKDALYDGLARAAKALGNGRRAQIVDVLAQGERPVEEIAEQIGQTVANTSQHLQFLLRAGLVLTRRAGVRIYYRLASEQVAQLWTMTRAELQRHLRDRDVVVLDVRPAPEFAAGHIPGALNVPIDDLQRRLSEIPAETQVVAYCRGPYCAYADDAVRLLSRRGRRALRLEDGFPEWVHAGLPVEAEHAEEAGVGAP